VLSSCGCLEAITDPSQQGRDRPGSQGGSPEIESSPPAHVPPASSPPAGDAPAVAVSGPHSTRKPPRRCCRWGRRTARAKEVPPAASRPLPTRRQIVTPTRDASSFLARHHAPLERTAKSALRSWQHVGAGTRCQAAGRSPEALAAGPTQEGQPLFRPCIGAPPREFR